MRIVLRRSKDRQFYFNIVSRNNRVIVTSETYKTRQGARKSITALQNAYFLAGVLDEEDAT